MGEERHFLRNSNVNSGKSVFSGINLSVFCGKQGM